MTRNSSSMKSRWIKAPDFYVIREHLLQNRTAWGRATAVWLAAATITGLRPSEWFNTRLVEGFGGTRTLVIPNAKATNGRANGLSRSLDLTDLESGLVAIVKRQLKFVAGFSTLEAFHRAYRSCRKTLYTATRRLWPNREIFISLYSARHQFSADAKAEGLSHAEIAALMGHASDATAKLHYGQRRSGRSGFRVRPIPGEVALVRRKYVSRAEYLARKSKIAIATPSSPPTR
jgi:integrase